MLSVIFPAYNEEKNIGPLLDEILGFLKKQKEDFEIICVNDGSTDGTAEVLSLYQTKARKLIIVTHEKNLGYGAALRSGFEKAKGDFIFFTDSDRQFKIQKLATFLDVMRKGSVDFIVGFRNKRSDPRLRVYYASIFRIISRIFFKVKVRDVDCAFKLFKREVIKGIPLASSGALINLEIFAQARKQGFKFEEMPVEHFSRKEGVQTGGSFRVLIRAAVGFFSLWERIFRKEISDFTRIFGIGLFSILLTYLIASLSFVIFRNRLGSLQEIWLRWDAFSYLKLAQNWYQGAGPNQFLIVYLPLYPTLIKIFGFVFGNNFLAALFISNVGYMAALVYLFKLTALDFSKKTALWTILFFSFFPSAYFLHAPYTEGLFMALLFSSFYYGRKGKWPYACILSTFAVATRLTGLVLIPALLLEYLHQKDFNVKKITKQSLWFLVSPVGFLIYLYLNFSVYGKVFAFQQIMSAHWFKHFSWPWNGIKFSLATMHELAWSGKIMINGSEVFFAVITFVFLVIGVRRLRPSYSLFGFLTLFMITSTSFILSTPRYVLAIFPIFLVIAFIL